MSSGVFREEEKGDASSVGIGRRRGVRLLWYGVGADERKTKEEKVVHSVGTVRRDRRGRRLVRWVVAVNEKKTASSAFLLKKREERL